MKSNQKDHVKNLAVHESPLVVGTGLLALDIVLSEVSGEPPRYWAGGTCGNVLMALAYLGWHAQPIARLQPGPAASRILSDLRHWGVSDRFVNAEDSGSTPVIVERITRGRNGIPRHSFSWRCPSCGVPFSAFKPVLASSAADIAPHLGGASVFFFDRATPGSLVLARACADAGALVMFEPSGIGNPVVFRQAWQVAHVVKYSHERLAELPEMQLDAGPRLQIETLGEGGLRYRLPGPRGGGRWMHLDAFPVEELRDPAGAGDWCSAGFISLVGEKGLNGFLKFSDTELRSALRYGQALAAWNCGFEGARGGMYAVDQITFSRQVQNILDNRSDSPIPINAASSRRSNPVKSVCAACGTSEEGTKTASKRRTKRA